MDDFPSDGGIALLRPPLLSTADEDDVIVAVYADASEDDQTFDNADLRWDIDGEPPELTPAPNGYWPVTSGVKGNVRITYLTGYGATRDTVPEPIRQAIRYLVEHYYNVRGPVNMGNIVTPIPMTVESLLTPYRVFRCV